MRSRPLLGRPLASSYDPTTRDAPVRLGGPEHRMPPSPYDRTLTPATVNWLHALPAAVCPRETAGWFPRIANRIARFWESPAMLESMFDELLIDRRLGRKGFPPKILTELRVLYAHYRTLHQPTHSGTGIENRKPPSLYDRALNPGAAKWLRELPDAVRPSQTAVRFPRIVNRLARFWDTPAMVRDVFDDLLVGRRPGRKGFPPEILVELRNLKGHWRTARPADADDVWSSEPDRGRKQGF